MVVYLHSQSGAGLVVQLVRISACHAEGRGFESRPDRQLRGSLSLSKGFFALLKYLRKLCCLGTKVPKGLVVRPMESFAFMQSFFDFILFGDLFLRIT